jgi:hypothetical protein
MSDLKTTTQVATMYDALEACVDGAVVVGFDEGGSLRVATSFVRSGEAAWVLERAVEELRAGAQRKLDS